MAGRQVSTASWAVGRQIVMPWDWFEVGLGSAFTQPFQCCQLNHVRSIFRREFKIIFSTIQNHFQYCPFARQNSLNNTSLAFRSLDEILDPTQRRRNFLRLEIRRPLRLSVQQKDCRAGPESMRATAGEARGGGGL